MKKISLEEIEKKYKISDYTSLYNRVIDLISNNKIQPVKASGINGKTPALYKQYWIIEAERDYSEYRKELDYYIAPVISTEYYISHMEQYVEDRQWILLFNDYIKKNNNCFKIPMSENERSFDIWHREKFLKNEQGKKILKRCNISTEHLNYYKTAQPLAYFSKNKITPQNILILENKDTFYSMRKYLLDGNSQIFGCDIGTLIYGAGKGVISMFSEFEISGEPYMLDAGNNIYYFGDLDYEGIKIYESFAAEYADKYNIRLFLPAYMELIAKADVLGFDKLPETKEKQNRNIGTGFITYFDEQIQIKIKEILESNRYIPQEILNISDF